LRRGSWADVGGGRPTRVGGEEGGEYAGRDRIATLCELQYRARLWNKAANHARRRINWRFTTADARRIFKYRAGTTPGPKD